MNGFWSTIGLCCIDNQFRLEAMGAANHSDETQLYAFLKEKNITLARVEVEDFRAVLRHPHIPNHMNGISSFWIPGCPEGYGHDSNFRFNQTPLGPK